MARTFAEETAETSNTTGTGPYTVDGAKGDYLPFEAGYVTGDKPAYVVRNKNNTKWEMNRGAPFTQGSPSTLARGVWKSSNSDAPVPWTVDDLPLTVYVPASAEVHEGVVTGWLRSARHALLRAGAFFWTTADAAVSWERYLAIGDAAQLRVGQYDAVLGLYFADGRRRSTAVGAADKVFTAAHIGGSFTFDTTGGPRIATLPTAAMNVKDGYRLEMKGLSPVNGIVLTPDSGEGIDGGADGATKTVPGGVLFTVRWDNASDQWLTDYVPAQAPNWAGRRQTAASGPRDTAGLPTFLPGSSVSLNLTTQNLDTTPLIVAAAAGWLAANGRPSDWIGRASANFTWSSLTASRAAATPNFIGAIANADGTLAPFATLLPPIYQWAGTPSTTNGQFTFNVSEMRGYLGNGTTAPQTNLVMLGEAATDGSTVTSTVTYAYNGRYDSGYTDTLPAAATPVSKSHNIGIVPGLFDFRAQCKTAEGGFAVGNELGLASLYDFDGTNIGHPSLCADRATLSVVATVTPWLVRNKSTAAQFTLTLANWKYRFTADRGW